jgi:ABC-2 type transport system permease protein
MRILRAFLARDVFIARSYRVALAAELVTGLANLLLYYFISRTFMGTTADLGAAPDYFAYAAVGAALATVLHASMASTAVSIRHEQLTGTLEATVSQPVSPAALALGLSGLPFLGAGVRVAGYLVIASALLGLDLSNASLGGSIAVLLTTAAALCGLGISAAAMVLVVKRGDAISGMLSFTIVLLSGAFFPISVLPDWLQPIGEVLPTRFAFDGLRSALFGGAWADDVLWLSVYAVILAPLSVMAFSKALDHTRKAGTMAEY